MEIELKFADSKMLNALGYDEDTQTMAVRFKNGDVWHYSPVPAEAFETIRDAHSVGQAFLAIRDQYLATKQE
jgi:hypothetical protein